MLCSSAAVMAAGYFLDAFGLPIQPLVLACIALVSGAAVAAGGRSRDRILPLLITVAAFAYAMWIASPAFLPVTNGPDVVHHLQLIHFIQRTHRLPHDPALRPYLVEMMGYTPGSHVLAAVTGAWLRVDPLRILYPLAAAFVAVKSGLLADAARRLIGPATHAPIAAAAASVLAFVPAAYFFGSFVQFFFYAQVVSEAFAVAVMVAMIAWMESGRRRDLVIAAVSAAGVVLSWPVWVGPCVVVVATAILSRPLPWLTRLPLVVGTLAPAGIILVFHQWRHPGAAGIVAAAGAVTTPSMVVFGAGFVVLSVAGAVLAAREPRARVVAIFLAAILAQSAALALLAARAGATSYYMACKMMYLAIQPAAVLGALALARSAAWLGARFPATRSAAAWIPLAMAVLLARGRVPVHRVHGSIELPARDVGAWARDHVPPGCIDYFSRYWLTGYWLHFDVLGQPRESDRMREETFEFTDAAAKWIEGRGLPFAIVEDLSSIPREIRGDMVPLFQSGRFVLVRNQHPSACR